jgi:putative N6-adenine-specific DNA methylase
METNFVKFYTIVPLGTESLAKEEIKEKLLMLYSFEINEFEISRGGLEYSLPFQYGLELTAYLKIATRQLLRIETFKARDLPKLYKKLLKINWNQYLRGQIPEIKSSSTKSRILDDRKVIKTTSDALNEFYKRQAPKKIYLESIPSLPKTTIYLRFDNDICTISLDLCGERLDQRGYKLLSSKAPLRESLAAAMIYASLKNSNLTTLRDPMCGSAVFGLEAAGFYSLSKSRTYYFNFIPSYKSHLTKLPDSLDHVLLSKYIASDIDEKTIEDAKANFKNANFKKIEHNFTVDDIFSKNNQMTKGNDSLIILNPPYGKRIKLDKPLKVYYEDLLTHLTKKFLPNRIAIIAPINKLPKALKGYTIIEKMKWSNGGIDIDFIIYQVLDQDSILR